MNIVQLSIVGVFISILLVTLIYPIPWTTLKYEQPEPPPKNVASFSDLIKLGSSFMPVPRSTMYKQMKPTALKKMMHLCRQFVDILPKRFGT
ncbi:unnamed protein product [Phyllotreta striolata]|uniref:Uncharacterized protein n=1 Tax=Phyllotreta striolata TaxID=444603 RepID=A0A9N9TF53_PHYSR|nr:unnamed protein product [Phyllotreta striolata]